MKKIINEKLDDAEPLTAEQRSLSRHKLNERFKLWGLGETAEPPMGAAVIDLIKEIEIITGRSAVVGVDRISFSQIEPKPLHSNDGGNR
jgi:hypothetical protein